MKECLYTGWVSHQRHLPRQHAFRYQLFMVCLDLDKLDSVFKGRWLWSARRRNLAWLRRADHLGPPEQPLKEAALDLVETRLGFRPGGPVFLLTHLRYFGHNFNPVSFYYCHDATGRRIEAIIAEINNTPWGERHCYVLDARAQQHKRVHAFSLEKTFHVSPFMPMAQTYEWRFAIPGHYLLVRMVNKQGGEPVFNATLHLERAPITGANLARVLLLYPLMTVKVVAAIYWEALRLWLKRTPFYAHPDKAREESLS
jgi:DUF1365 family protein